MIPQRVKRQNAVVVTVVLVTVVAVIVAVVLLLWHLANSVDLS
jgi:hypothetical protein